MNKNALLKNNNQLIKNIYELLENGQEEEIANCLYRLLEILNRASLSDTNHVYKDYAILQEDESLFDQLVCKVNQYLLKKYGPVEDSKELILKYQKLDFSVVELEKIDEQVNALTRCLNGFDYSKKERREIENLLQKLGKLRITFLPLFQDDNDRGIDIVRRLSKKEQAKIWKVLKSRRTVKEVFDDFTYNVQDAFESVKNRKKKPFSIKKLFSSLKSNLKDGVKKESGEEKSFVKKFKDKISSNKDTLDYLSYKSYCLASSFMKKTKNKISCKEVKKYSDCIQKLYQNYEKILKNSKYRKYWDEVHDFSMNNVKTICEQTKDLFKNRMFSINHQCYVDSIQNSRLSENELSDIMRKFENIYHENFQYKVSMDQHPDELKQIKMGYKKFVRKFFLTGTGIAVVIALLASSFVSKKGSSMNEEKKKVVIVTPKEDALELEDHFSFEQKSLLKKELNNTLETLLKAREQLRSSEICIGDSISIDEDAYIYNDIYSLAYKENSKKPIYLENEERTVLSIIYQNEDGKLLEMKTMDSHEDLLSHGYYVIGYTVANQYSTENMNVEGRYSKDDVMQLTRK